MVEREKLAEAILIAGLDDWVMLVDVESIARQAAPRSTPDELAEVAVGVIEALALDGLAQVGDVRAPDGFVSWGVAPTNAAERIRSEWRGLGRNLEMGDICWLSNTPLGDEWARQVTGD